MKRIPAIPLLLMITSICLGQGNKDQFGFITLDDFNYAHDEDPSAEAVILYDRGNTSFLDTPTGFEIRFQRTKRIKILSEGGLEFAEISIPLYQDGYGRTELLKNLEASTYNLENGQRVKIDVNQKEVFEEQLNSQWVLKKFIFPGAKKGSILEFRYDVITPFLFNLPDWEFQDKIPTLFSEYTIRLIPFYEYVFIAQGIDRFAYQNSRVSNDINRWFQSIEYKEMIHVYALKNVPAFKDETYITSINDYKAKLDFQLSKIHYPNGVKQEIMSSWEKLIENLLKEELFGKYIGKSKKIAEKELFPAMNMNSDEPITAQNIINYVKSSFSWNDSYSKYASKKPNEFFDQKSGNSADINLFLAGALQAANINAKPVLLSTRNHGKVNDNYPFIHLFNYVVVIYEEGGSYFLVDASEPLISTNRIPTRCINEKGLIIDDSQVNWVDLFNSINSIDHKNIHLFIEPEDLKVKTKVSIQSTEFEAYHYRNRFKNNLESISENLSKLGFEKIDTVLTFNYQEINDPYIITLVGESSVEKLDNQIIVMPFLNFPISDNPFTQKSRSYPVDFIYKTTKTFTSYLNIPNDYSLASLPKNFNLDNSLMKVGITYERTENSIVIKGDYSFKKSIYQPQEYTYLKSTIDLVVKNFNQPIIFEPL